jgi:DNA invertase Pin-like site-specific DNA recombinase
MSATPTGYSYIRFSSPEQRKGDSLRRQTEGPGAWCERNGVALDTALTLHDLGKSAYTGEHRKNPDRHALALFLKLVEQGKVPRGSYLLVENLDRLSREDEVPACNLLTGILMAGIRVVQLSPYEMVLTEKSNGWELMRAVMELSRGHGESALKSTRIKASWVTKRKDAKKGVVMTRRLPGWIEEHQGRLRLIPAKAATVRRIFEMAAGGFGLTRIVNTLTKDKTPPLGRGDKWVQCYVALILGDRRAIGEYQPKDRDNKPDGEVIKGYYPAVVTPELWYKVRAGMEDRRRIRGRTGKHVALFSGMLRDARSTDAYFSCTRTLDGTHYRVLMTTGARDGRYPSVSFPMATFEEAVLSLLKEVDPREVLNGDSGPDETLVLAGELATVEARLEELGRQLEHGGHLDTLVKVVAKLEATKAALVGQLAEARRKAANPVSESWGECKSLLETLRSAPEESEARLRLRSSLRRVIASCWLLCVPKGRGDRLLALQVYFNTDHKGKTRRRDYLVYHRTQRYNGRGKPTPGHWWCRSFADLPAPDDLDLRKPDHVRRLEAVLVKFDPDAVAE